MPLLTSRAVHIRFGWDRPQCLAALLAFALAVQGCATSPVVKTASREHGDNLVALGGQVNAYKAILNNYYDGLVQRERDAFVAQMVGRDLDRIVSSQLSELNGQRAPPTPDKESQDFIAKSLELASARDKWRKQFDLWLDSPGDSNIGEKRASVRKQLGQLDARIAALDAKDPDFRSTLDRLRRAQGKLSRLLEMKDDDLSYVIDALNLNQQRANLNRELDILALQLQVMKNVHGVIDTYLQADATIDGAKIAEAAKAGASLDLSKYPELTGLAASLAPRQGAAP
jgi:hypothetical protein